MQLGRIVVDLNRERGKSAPVFYNIINSHNSKVRLLAAEAPQYSDVRMTVEQEGVTFIYIY